MTRLRMWPSSNKVVVTVWETLLSDLLGLSEVLFKKTTLDLLFLSGGFGPVFPAALAH